eukprot:GHVP01021686.1.p1 GENE.GHVP01021686.1~~GHVP01021686.1.p1  ORF type:complete len:236 (+),score=37.26 GHVP01021686.1:13-720(+)
MQNSIQEDAPIFVPDDQAYPLDEFLIPKYYEGDLSHVLIPEALLKSRIDKLAADLSIQYAGKQVHCICILKGARVFFHNIMNAISLCNMSNANFLPFMEHYLKVKSYEGDASTGKVQLSNFSSMNDIKGKDVLIFEDIVDTGLTLKHLFDEIKNANPASVKCVSMLEKRTLRSNGLKADFVGFSIPDAFVVGQGLDFEDLYRDLKDICVVSPSTVERHKTKMSENAPKNGSLVKS